jgi:hypothetical protein
MAFATICLLSDSKNQGGPSFNNRSKPEENLDDAMGGLLRSSV